MSLSFHDSRQIKALVFPWSVCCTCSSACWSCSHYLWRIQMRPTELSQLWKFYQFLKIHSTHKMELSVRSLLFHSEQTRKKHSSTVLWHQVGSKIFYDAPLISDQTHRTVVAEEVNLCLPFVQWDECVAQFTDPRSLTPNSHHWVKK